MPDNPRLGPDAEPHALGERLESWKEIAAYLRRDVRTVQRWEQTDGLPVHRLKRAHRAIPHAYKAELDAWWTSRSDHNPVPSSPVADSPRFRTRHLVAALTAMLVIVATMGAYWMMAQQVPRAAERAARGSGANANEAVPSSAPAPLSQKSIAVLPFLDLSEGMKHEEFADGMTEELINRLIRIPGLRVPAPTASFYFKNKKIPVADIAKSLGVAHVVDGSVRRSGGRLRVAVRLVRPESGYVVWAETYDRPWNDILAVQDDIAGEVTKALAASIESRPDRPRTQEKD